MDAADDAGTDAAREFDKPDAAVDGGRLLSDDGGAMRLEDGAVVYLRLSSRPCPSDSTLDYEGFGRPFFEAYCLACHSAANEGSARGSAPVGVDFDEPAGIHAAADRIFEYAADRNEFMPYAGPAPSSRERYQLGDWLACGAK